jgi:hypothetical protein
VSTRYLQYEKRRLDGANAFVGARVVRGPDWDAGGGREDEGSQPGEHAAEGSIVGCVPPEGDARGPSGDAPRFAEMARVRWDNGNTGDYKIGRRGKHQLVFAHGFDAASKRPRQSVVFRDAAKLRALQEAAEAAELASESASTRAKYAQGRLDQEAEQPAFDDDEEEDASDEDEVAEETEEQKAAATAAKAAAQEAKDAKVRAALAMAERRRQAKTDPVLAAQLEEEDRAKDAARKARLGNK